jgi:hypothetical protein
MTTETFLAYLQRSPATRDLAQDMAAVLEQRKTLAALERVLAGSHAA